MKLRCGSYFFLGALFVVILSWSARSLAMPQQKILPHPSSVYAGFYNIGGLDAGYDQFIEKSAGNAPAIVFTFHDWNQAGVEAEIPILQTFAHPLEGESISVLDFAERISQQGSVLAVAWDAIGYFFEHPDYWTGGGNLPIKWDDVFSGKYDDYIRQVAKEVKSFDKPIMLSVAGEMNALGFTSFGPEGDQYYANISEPDQQRNQYGDPTIPDGPERVRDLFRHVIDVFREEQVSNVTWFMYSGSGYMNPNALAPEEVDELELLHPKYFYPGDEYLDWIGNSAYIDAENPELDLEYAIGPAIDAFREVTDKPLFLPEFGVVSSSGVNRAERMRQLFDEEMLQFDDVKAFAFADGALWEQFFEIPRLGHDAEELEVWQQSVWQSNEYTNDVLVTEVPEAATFQFALAGILLTIIVVNRQARWFAT